MIASTITDSGKVLRKFGSTKIVVQRNSGDEEFPFSLLCFGRLEITTIHLSAKDVESISCAIG